MKEISNFLKILVICIFFQSCKESENKKPIDVYPNKENKLLNQSSDSIELTKLVRVVYKWHESKTVKEFPYKYDKENDSIFTGIDWKKYRNTLNIFKDTKFFSKEFILKHERIAMTLDSSITKANISWRNINDGIPIWDSGADDWCNCQDYPDNYWDFLTINHLNIKNDFASFSWTWDDGAMKNEHSYKMSAKKEDGKWKINSIDGFENFYSVKHYDKIMSEKG